MPVDRYFNCHSHSVYSPQDGHALVDEYVAKIASLGHTHVTLTDHGRMGAMPLLWREAKKHGLVPLAGMEAYTTPFTRQERIKNSDPAEIRSMVRKSYHLTLVGIDASGYDSLMALSHVAWGDGYYGKPRVDHLALRTHSAGVVCLSGCYASELSQAILREDDAEIHRLLDFYLEVYGERFFLELQNHPHFDEQKIINKRLLELSRKHGIPAVGTNDSHFCEFHDHIAHRYLLQSGGKSKQDPETGEQSGIKSSAYTYVRSNEEMVRAFGDSALIRNTNAIAAMATPYDLGDDRPKLPNAPLSLGNPKQRIRELTDIGLRARLGILNTDKEIPEAYQKRLDYELGVVAEIGAMKGANLEEYFLIVAEITRFARMNKIPYGPRGSAAGSIICWALGISEPDPLKHDLYFERFLNIERVSMPDIDLDFADDRRKEIFAFIRDTYGPEYVARIATYTRIGPKMAIRNACTMLENKLTRDHVKVGDELSGLVPQTQNPLTLKEVLEEEGSQLAARVEADADARAVMDKAKMIAGRTKTSGTHPGGVVVASQPISELVPVMSVARGKIESEPITQQVQFDMNELEAFGLLKMDILGLSELSKMQATLDLVQARHGIKLDLWALPLTDQDTWDVINDGDTLGLFQLGGVNMTKALLQIQPRTLADLALLIAIYRPGPMENLGPIARRKRGEEPIVSIHPALDGILRPTYGFPVLQEQVIEIVQKFAGVSRGKADKTRKAMGKKDKEALAKEEKDFRELSLANGYTEEEVSRVWSFIQPFVGYGFNKAHAICYAYLGYQSAWLKAHFPIEFYTAAFNVESRKDSTKETIGLFAAEAARRGITLLPPSIDDPCIEFEPRDNKTIRYGLGAVKGIKTGGKALAKGYPYADLKDFVMRCDANVGNMITLAKIGGLPWGGRAQQVQAITDLNEVKNKALTVNTRKNETKESARARGLERLATAMAADYEMPDVDEYSKIEQLLLEREMLGINFGTMGRIKGTTGTAPIGMLGHHLGQRVWVPGLVVQLKHRTNRRKQPFADGIILDQSGQVEFLIWPSAWQKLLDQGIEIKRGDIIRLGATVTSKNDEDLDEMDNDDPLPPSLLHLKAFQLTLVAPLTVQAGEGDTKEHAVPGTQLPPAQDQEAEATGARA